MPLPVTTLLSQVLVALTIELDNELEQRMPHFTSASLKQGRPSSGPWLTSFVMWANLLRLVPADGTTVADLQRRGRLVDGAAKAMVAGMKRWGYLSVSGGRVWPTGHGVAAQNHWPAVLDDVEARWRERWGPLAVPQPEEGLPAYLPMLRHQTGFAAEVGEGECDDDLADRLVTRLSRALLVRTLAVERGSTLSLALGAGVLRWIDGDGIAVRDLPGASGVAKETVTYALGQLEKQGLVEVADRVARRMPAGDEALSVQQAAIVDDAGLRAALEPLVGEGALAASPLRVAVEPPPGGWRSGRPLPATLPHHPMVTHRGGYPDGS